MTVCPIFRHLIPKYMMEVQYLSHLIYFCSLSCENVVTILEFLTLILKKYIKIALFSSVVKIPGTLGPSRFQVNSTKFF